MHKEIAQQAWNAALDHIEENTDDLTAPSEAFDEWYEREVANPPEGWFDHHAT